MVFKIFLNLCCHLNLLGVGRSKRHWLIFTMTRLALYAWSRMSTLKYKFDSLGSCKCQCDLSPSNTR